MQPILTRLCQAYADKHDIKPDVIPASSIKKLFGLIHKPVPAKTKPIEDSAFVETPDFVKYAVRAFYKECQEYLSEAGFPDENFLIELIDEGKFNINTLNRGLLEKYDERMPSICIEAKKLAYAEEKLANFPQNTGIKETIEKHTSELKIHKDILVSDLRRHLEAFV